MIEPSSLYVHIPFCRHMCAYCDFAKVFYQEQWADSYLDCLQIELEQRQAVRPFRTVYIGGGSPSALNEPQLGKLLALLKLPLSQCEEATIEVNPEDLTKSKAIMMKQSGINRVSLGVQTFNQNLLERIGRHHDLKTIQKAVNILNEVGIPNISFDFIYGLPGQRMEDLKADLEILSHFETVGHVSFYTLILEEHTRFFQENVQLMEDDWLIEAQNILLSKLETMGYRRYEVSNFAKENQASKHNLVYWHNQHYIGVGCGASGYVGDVRYDNTRSLTQYLKGMTTLRTTKLTIKDQMFEALMLGLRLVEGVNLNVFENRFDQTINEVFDIQPYLDNGLLILENGHLRTSTQGMDVLDEILLSFM